MMPTVATLAAWLAGALLIAIGLALWHHAARIASAVEYLAEACWSDAMNLPPPGHVGRRRAARGYVARERGREGRS